MVYEDLQTFVQRKPFAPIRLYLTDGNHLDVWHQEMILVTRRSVSVGLRLSPDSLELERIALLDMLHIVRVEPLERPAPKPAATDRPQSQPEFRSGRLPGREAAAPGNSPIAAV